jgi:hypothetical protein
MQMQGNGIKQLKKYHDQLKTYHQKRKEEEEGGGGGGGKVCLPSLVELYTNQGGTLADKV